MPKKPNQPDDYDAVLGGQTSVPFGSVVLGGLEGVKRRLASTVVQARIAALKEALNYGQAGSDLLIEASKCGSAEVEQAAYLLLRDRAELQVKQTLQGYDICDALVSAVGVDYRPLSDLLTASKWKEADQETTAIMLKVCDREKEGCLSLEDIAEFPCSDLRTIDQLWVRSSEGRFGFTVQKCIWQSIEGTANPDWDAWCRFGACVGWYANSSWLWWNDLTFTLNASVGHLPRGGAFAGWGLGDFWTGCSMFSSLASKMEGCNCP